MKFINQNLASFMLKIFKYSKFRQKFSDHQSNFCLFSPKIINNISQILCFYEKLNVK